MPISKRVFIARDSMPEGASSGQKHPVILTFTGGAKMKLCGEVKARKEFPAWLVNWLGENDFLALRENGKEPLYIVPHNVWIRILQNDS